MKRESGAVCTMKSAMVGNTAGGSSHGPVASKGYPVAPVLSAREREILVWVAMGKSNRDIGGILRISPHTVATYLKRILTKLEVSSRTTAAVRAAQLGLLPVI